MSRATLAAVLAVPILAACGGSTPPPPRPPASVPVTVVVVDESGWGALDHSTSHLPGRPLAAPSDGAVRPAAARFWSRSADFRQWTFDVDAAADWAASWPGPGEASAPAPTTLVVRLDAPDPDLPSRLCALAPVQNGPYTRPSNLGSEWRLFTPRTPGRPPLHVGASSDSRLTVDSFRAGRLTRVDFIPADRATAVRTHPSFRSIEAAWTIALVVDLNDPAERAAVAALVDPPSLCRRALFDPPRAATRLAPAALGLGQPPDLRPVRTGTPPHSLTLAADRSHPEPAAFVPHLRAALRQAGIEPAESDPAHPARLRVVRLAAESPALDDFFGTLRPLASDHPELEPLFEALSSATDPAERADWARALEGALLDSRLVVPLARGAIYSLANPGSGLELDVWGRYVPVDPAGR